MNTRKDRLLEAYDHLRQYHCIHTKKDLAESIHHTLPAIYSAFSGNDSYLTDSLFKKICDAFPQTFNLQYLLTGEGQLTYNTETDLGTSSTNYTKSEKDIISLATDLIVELESMRRQTKDELAQLRQVRQSFESATAELHKLLTTLSHSNSIQHHHDYFSNLAAEDTSTPSNTNKNP